MINDSVNQVLLAFSCVLFINHDCEVQKWTENVIKWYSEMITVGFGVMNLLLSWLGQGLLHNKVKSYIHHKLCWKTYRLCEIKNKPINFTITVHKTLLSQYALLILYCYMHYITYQGGNALKTYSTQILCTNPVTLYIMAS